MFVFYCVVRVCTVGYGYSFHGDEIFVDFVMFLSMMIYEVLYTWCLRYNVCNTWFLDIRYKNINLFTWNYIFVNYLAGLYFGTIDSAQIFSNLK